MDTIDKKFTLWEMAERFLPDIEISIENQNELTLLAMCVWGEARNQTPEGMLAVAYVVCNRAKNKIKWEGENVRDVILKPWQFSVFNPNDPNRAKLLSGPYKNSKVWRDCFCAAFCAVSELEPDPTCGADHYMTSFLFDNHKRPDWADRKRVIKRIDDHVFLA